MIGASLQPVNNMLIKDNNYKYRKLCILKKISILLLCGHLVFVFINTDMYLGIADYYIFLIGYVMCGGLIAFVSDKKIGSFSKYVMFVLIWMFIPLIIALFYGEVSTGYCYSYILYLLILFIALNSNYSAKNIKNLINAYLLAGVILGWIIIVQRYDYYGGGGNRYTIKFLNNDAIDPNFLGAFLLFPALISLAKILKKPSVFRLVAVLSVCGGMLLTSSRAAMLSFFMGSIFIIIYSIKNAPRQMRIKILLFIGILCMIALLVLPKNILERFFENDYFDNSNRKRLLDWLMGLEAFKKHPIFGYGFRSELSIIRDITGKELIAHNTYIAFLLQFGIIGCGILLMGIIKLFMLLKRNLLLTGVMFSNLMVCIFISAETAIFFWFPFIIICISAQHEGGHIGKNEWL